MKKIFTIALAATVCAAAIVTTSCKGYTRIDKD